MTMLEPGFDRIVVLPDPAEELTAGGLFKPNAEPPQRGTVVAIGPKVEFYAEADVVLYGRYAGTPVVLDGTEYLVLHEPDVLCRVKDS